MPNIDNLGELRKTAREWYRQIRNFGFQLEPGDKSLTKEKFADEVVALFRTELEAQVEQEVKRILRDKKQARHYGRKLTEEEKLGQRRMVAKPWGVAHCNRCDKDVFGPSEFTVFLGATKKDDYSAHTDCLTEAELATLTTNQKEEKPL